MRRKDAGVQFVGHRVWRPATPAAGRGPSAGGDQPLRALQADDRGDPARPAPQRPILAHSAVALFQPGRRARPRPDRRGPAGHPQQPDALRSPGGGRAARIPQRLGRRLSDPGRHRGARLHPRRRSCARPPEGAGTPARARRVCGGEPRHRHGLFGAADGARVRGGQRQTGALSRCRAPPRRHRVMLRRPGAGPHLARLERATRT